MGRSRITAIVSMTVAILMIGTTLALASSVTSSVVDTSAPTGSVTLAPGTSGQIQIAFSISGSQDATCTFKAYKDWTLSGGTFTGSNPQTFTATGPRVAGQNPTPVQNIGPIAGSVTVAASQSPQAAAFSLSVTVFDIQCANQTGAKLGAGTAGTYAVTVAGPTDSTPPVISPNVSGLRGNPGWYVGDVSLSWSVTDGQSAVSSSNGCDAASIQDDTNGTTFTCRATSLGGTASASVTIKRDATPPTMTATLDPAANAGGWNRTDVGVTFACDDGGGSGIDPNRGCPAPESLTDEGHHELQRSTADLAGNAITPTFTVDIDRTLPTISGSGLPAPNEHGWRNEAVTVTFECFDDLSEIASCAGDTTLPSEGADQSVQGTATDNAGNQKTGTVGDIDIDLTPPGIGFVGTPPSGWIDHPVTLSWNCTDELSGPASSTVSLTLEDEGAAQSATGVCADRAGNTAQDTQDGVNIDLTPPTITFESRTAANGAGWNDGAVSVTWTCEDGVSDVVEDSVMDLVTTDGADQTASGTCEDLAGNTASAELDGINIDTVDPTIVGHVSPQATNGWHNTDVVVSFTCQDDPGGSGIATDTVEGGTLTDEGVGQWVKSTGDCVDEAGNAAAPTTVSGIRIDKTEPVIAGVASPAANDAGWNNTDVEVSFGCTDEGGSGVDQNDVAGAILTAEGIDLEVTNTGTCVDAAGNVAELSTVSGINIDRTRPVITGHVPDPNLLGWYHGDVEVSFSCADEGGSLIASNTVEGGTLSGDHEDLSLSNLGECVDAAGNEAETASVSGIDIDASAPVIADAGPTVPAPAGGWYTSAVTNAFTADGLISGLADASKASFQVSSGTAEGDSVTIPSGAVSDNAGNTNLGIDSATFKIDLTDPRDVAFVAGPASNTSYLFRTAPAAPSCTAEDDVSGLASCVVTGYSAAVGRHTLTATATDHAGRTTTITRDYTIDPWTLRGFYAPVDMSGVWNSVKGGATVPLKFEVFAGIMALSDTAAVQGFTVKGVACPGTSVATDDIELTTTGGTSLRYDSTGGQFIQNWQTPKKPGACYTVTMTTLDGSPVSANFKLK